MTTTEQKGAPSVAEPVPTRRVQVSWQTTETFHAVIELPVDLDPEELDGDSQELVDLESPNAVDANGHSAYTDTVREVEKVQVLP